MSEALPLDSAWIMHGHSPPDRGTSAASVADGAATEVTGVLVVVVGGDVSPVLVGETDRAGALKRLGAGVEIVDLGHKFFGHRMGYCTDEVHTGGASPC